MSSPASPPILEIVVEMLQVALAIYGLADLRTLARNGRLPEPVAQAVLYLPLESHSLYKLMMDNADKIRAMHGGEFEMYLNALNQRPSSRILSQQTKTDIETPLTTAGAAGTALAASPVQASKILHFDDENSASELVYALGINSSRKRITVCFRGSVTVQDFMADANQTLVPWENSVESDESYKSTKYVGLHKGFHDYLFASHRARRRSNDSISKYEKIQHQLRNLMNLHPGYELYITGHSLGGALSTLLAFQLAAADRNDIVNGTTSRTVHCVTIASPRVGGLAFRRAFQALERQGHLRCLRVANHRDLVTMLPDRGTLSLAYLCLCQSSVYRHVGVQLRLKPDSKYFIDYPSQHSHFCSQAIHDSLKLIRDKMLWVLCLPIELCCCARNVLAFHSCDTYLDRLVSLGKLNTPLATTTLKDVYDRLWSGEEEQLLGPAVME